MLLERIYDDDLAQASYFIGCQASGEAIVIDPRRDIDVYQKLAAKHGMRIVAVTETHIHADYLSGTRELTAAGVTAYVSGEGGADWTYRFDAATLRDGDTIQIGNITVLVRHTPGHTPEHLMFLVTDGAFADEPGYALTGDFVFAGDLGRPDLIDEAAGGVDTRFQGARDMFRSLQTAFLTLPDHVQVLPAHGAGSACGKALGAIPSSTVGYERRHAWWSTHLERGDEEGFVAELLRGQPDAHAYFARMKRENRDGPKVLGPLCPLAELATEDVRRLLADDEAIFVDTRPQDLVHQGTVEASLNIPGPAKAASFGAWVYDPDSEQRPLVLLASDAAEAEQIRQHLLRVGIDAVAGYVASLDGLPQAVPRTISPERLGDVDPSLLLDVRSRNEYADEHIPGARQLSAGRIMWHLHELPAKETIVTYCQSGTRNSVASSALRRRGYEVVELEGSFLGWKALSNSA